MIYLDIFVQDMLYRNMSSNQILSIVLDENFIKKDMILNNAKKSIESLYERELSCNIQIAGYIEEHYKEEQLFYSFNHPNERLLNEYVNRIIEYLGYARQDFSLVDILLQCGTLKGHDIPVYPCVIKALGLKKYETEFYPNRYQNAGLLLNTKEFIEAIIKDFKESYEVNRS